MRIELERLFWKIQGTVFKVKDRTMQREAMDARQELFVVLEGFERSGRPELRLGEEKRKRIRDEVAKAKGFEGFMMEDMASQRNRDGFNEAEEDLVVTEVGDMGFNTGWAAWYVEMLVKLGEEVEEKGRRGLMSEETVARQRRAVERERRRVIIEWDLWNQRMEARARGEMEGILRYNTDVVWRKEGEVWVASDGTRIEEASMRQFGAYIFGDEDAGVAVATQALRMGTGAAQRQARGATQGQVRPRGGAQSQGRARNTRQAQQRQRPPAPDDGDTPMGGA